jgi:hypothetical protein
MDRLHLVVSATLGLCSVWVLVGAVWNQPGLSALSAVVGWGFSLAALSIALVLIIVLGYRSFSGTAGPLFHRSWLGLVNAILAVGFWVYFGL